jgi:hypothetical protein
MAHKMQKSLESLLSLQSLQEEYGGTTTMVMNKSSQKGLRNGWTRATFILRNDYLEKIKALAYWERKKVKEVIDEALEAHLKGKKTKLRKGQGQ